MILGALFDFDDTLYDYTSANAIATHALIFNISTENSLTYELVHNSYNLLTSNIKKSNNSATKFNKSIYIKKLLEMLNISCVLYNKYMTFYNDIFEKNMHLYDGVITFFKLLKLNNIKIGIVSNNIYAQQYEKLKKFNLLEYIDIIQTSDESSEEKPNNSIFLDALHKIKIKSENIAYFGDDLINDISPAIKFNMLPFFFEKEYKCKCKWNNNYFEYSNYNDICTYFKNYFLTTNELIFLSKYFGQSILNAQGAGGNISIKNDNQMFIKSSGQILKNMSYLSGYTIVNNTICLNNLKTNVDNLDITKIFGIGNPSIETYFHSFMKKYVVHIHFIPANIFLCSSDIYKLNNESKIKFKIIEYDTPGITLAIKILDVYSATTDIYFLKNHGLIITSDDIHILLNIYNSVYFYFNDMLKNKFDNEFTSFNINEIYYFKYNRQSIIKYINYTPDILKNIIYCFPDMAVFIKTIITINTLDDLIISDIVIINNCIYVCSDSQLINDTIVELLETYKHLYEYCKTNDASLIKIHDSLTLQNMQTEIYRINNLK